MRGPRSPLALWRLHCRAQLATTTAGVLGAQGRKNKRNSPPSSCFFSRACVLSGGWRLQQLRRRRRKEEEGEREREKKKGVRGGQRWRERKAPQHHRRELPPHPSLPSNLTGSVEWEVCEVRGRPGIRTVEGSNLDLSFYFSFSFKFYEPKAQVRHQYEPTNIFILFLKSQKLTSPICNTCFGCSIHHCSCDEGGYYFRRF